MTLLRQTWRDEKVRIITETPKDLYQMYLNFSVILPFNATSWPLQLPPTFLSDLEKKFRRRISFDDYFCMSGLSMISTKSKHLKGLREVRIIAVRNQMKLEEDITNLKEVLQLKHKYSSCVSCTIELQQQEPIDATNIHPVLFQQSVYLAEHTISTYKKPYGTLPPPTPPPSSDRQPVFPTRFVPETAKQHPFHPELNQVGRFPLGFCGCYACGQEDHFRSKNCPLKRNGKFNKREFSKNYGHIS